MMLTCRPETGIKAPADFKGKTLGVWFFGNEYPFLAWMSKLGIPTRRRCRRRQGPEAGLQRRPSPAEAGRLHLDHGLQRILAGHRRGPEAGRASSSSNIEDQGVATLEDGLYVLEDRLKDEKFVDVMARFVKAFMEGL